MGAVKAMFTFRGILRFWSRLGRPVPGVSEAGIPGAWQDWVQAVQEAVSAQGLDLCGQLRALLQGVARALSPRSIAFLVLAPEQATAVLADGPAVSGLEPTPLRLDSPLVAWMNEHRTATRWSDLVVLPQIQGMAAQERALVGELAPELVVPFHGGERLTGLLLLGPRARGAPYQGGERQVLAALARATARGIEHARLFAREHARVAELEELDRKKTEAIFYISHQLKTPITAVKASAEMLLEGDSPRLRQRLVAAIARGADALDHLVTELLEYGKTQSVAARLAKVETDLRALVQEACDVVQPLLKERKQRLDVQVQGGLPTLLVDPHRVQQVLLNLLTNAIKFSPEGGPIGLQVTRQEGRVLVQVRDTGPGIPEEQQRWIFEPFRRTPGKGEPAGGTGLGLAIAKALTELHGGAIWVESQEGAGSTFSFTLPLWPREAREPDKAAASPTPVEPATASGGGTP